MGCVADVFLGDRCWWPAGYAGYVAGPAPDLDSPCRSSSAAVHRRPGMHALFFLRTQ